MIYMDACVYKERNKEGRKESPSIRIVLLHSQHTRSGCAVVHGWQQARVVRKRRVTDSSFSSSFSSFFSCACYPTA